MEGEIPTIIMNLDTNTNTRETNQIGPDILYQADITDYIKRSIYFKENIRNLYTVIWELCYKYLQNSIETNI